MATIKLGNALNGIKSSQSAQQFAKGVSALRYKKLLLVCKESKLTRFQNKGIIMSDYIEKNYKQSM